MTKPAFSYDEVPYSSFTFPQTRPDRLATLAAFHGMKPAAPDQCRVLELGCGDGTNLISFAYILPQSEFVGIDLSSVHIDAANRMAQELKLENLTFTCGDVMDATRESLGEFDYIIAHGLFSWVPEGVRVKILNIYKECLAPQGVGYISYNAFPGCYVRQMIWGMMKYHTSAINNPADKVHNGINFLNFLVHATPKDSLYQSMIKMELSAFGQRTAENIFHDDFASINQPYYFHEFVEMLNANDLQFLSEVDSFWMESEQLSPEILKKLDELGDDVIRREQYLDFIRCRPFRSTLFCHSDSELERRPAPEILRDFYLASQAEPKASTLDLTSTEPEVFVSLEGTEFNVSHPMTKSALFHLQGSWSRSVKFDALAAKAAEFSGDPSTEGLEKMTTELLDLFKRGLVYLHRYSPDFTTDVSRFPAASKFAQWQIRKKAADITTLSGMNLKPDGDLMRLLILLCDGTRDREALQKEVIARIKDLADQAEIEQQFSDVVDAKLAEMARLGLLES